MAIPFIHVVDGPPYESCCFCREQTNAWSHTDSRTPGEQVALCPCCALQFDVADLPTKRAWCDKERKIFASTITSYQRYGLTAPPSIMLQKERIGPTMPSIYLPTRLESVARGYLTDTHIAALRYSDTILNELARHFFLSQTPECDDTAFVRECLTHLGETGLLPASVRLHAK